MRHFMVQIFYKWGLGKKEIHEWIKQLKIMVYSNATEIWTCYKKIISEVWMYNITTYFISHVGEFNIKIEWKI